MTRRSTAANCLQLMFFFQLSMTTPVSAFLVSSRSSFRNVRTAGKVLQMSSIRGTAPGSKFESWYQRTVQTLIDDQNLTPLPMDPLFSSNTGNLGKSNVVFHAKAWESKSLRYARLISFVGEGYDVFNFMAIPREGLDIPILGIDVVSLPSKCYNCDLF